MEGAQPAQPAQPGSLQVQLWWKWFKRHITSSKDVQCKMVWSSKYICVSGQPGQAAPDVQPHRGRVRPPQPGEMGLDGTRWDMGLDGPYSITLSIMTNLLPGPAGQADPLPGCGHLHQPCWWWWCWWWWCWWWWRASTEARSGGTVETNLRVDQGVEKSSSSADSHEDAAGGLCYNQITRVTLSLNRPVCYVWQCSEAAHTAFNRWSTVNRENCYFMKPLYLTKRFLISIFYC